MSYDIHAIDFLPFSNYYNLLWRKMNVVCHDTPTKFTFLYESDYKQMITVLWNKFKVLSILDHLFGMSETILLTI